ncbi:MAG: winged helix-turn-helix domain-containing protein [Pseudomonadota bacterium]|nr:winged helix-turn-helix domain-containing protein [Pseudomonadota bacterium]
MGPTISGVLRIGSLRVDPAVDEIEYDGRVIKLEPKAMRLLLCLAERAGEVVSVEQLLDGVWKDAVVTPDSVYQTVAGLRRILGDDPKNPVYIANVVRRGYRLVAPVTPWMEPPGAIPSDTRTPGDALPQPAGPPVKASAMTKTLWSRTYRIALFIAVVLALSIVTRQYWRPTRGNATIASSVVVQDSSVAVLPFRDESANKDQEFFADGLTEEIIELLANVPALRVPARTSSFYFKDKSTDVREIAKILGVAHVLEGSVRRSGDNLRITTTLVRASNGYQIWSQTYELSEANIFAIQRDIAVAVVRNLAAVMIFAQPGRSAPVNAEAYNGVLRGRFLLNRGSEKDNREAIAVLQSAIEIDPKLAVAWAQLARAHRHRSSYFDETPDADIALARSEAQKALTLDPNCVEAHIVLADIKRTYDYDPVGGMREIEAADAADSTGRVHDRDLFYFYTGCVIGSCYDQAIRDTDEDIANDPLNPIPYWTQALARYMFGDLAGAERNIRHAMALSPKNTYQHYLLARILFARHDLTQLSEMTKVLPDSLYNRASLVLAYHALGRGSEAEVALRDLITHNSKDGAYQLAEVYAAQGQFNDAMTWLERGYVQHDSALWTLQVNPLFRPLANNPRFVALKAKLHM